MIANAATSGLQAASVFLRFLPIPLSHEFSYGFVLPSSWRLLPIGHFPPSPLLKLLHLCIHGCHMRGMRRIQKLWRHQLLGRDASRKEWIPGKRNLLAKEGLPLSWPTSPGSSPCTSSSSTPSCCCRRRGKCHVMLLLLLRLILWQLWLLCTLLLLLLLLGLRELCFHLRVIFTPRPTRAL